jgi:hypothetical protein
MKFSVQPTILRSDINKDNMQDDILRGDLFLWRPTVALCQLGGFRSKQEQDAASIAKAFCRRKNAANLYYVHVCADFPMYGATMGAVAINRKHSNTIVQGSCAGSSIQRSASGGKCRHLRL